MRWVRFLDQSNYALWYQWCYVWLWVGSVNFGNTVLWMDQIESVHGRTNAHTRHSIVLVVALNRLGHCVKRKVIHYRIDGLDCGALANPGAWWQTKTVETKKQFYHHYQQSINTCLIKKNFSRTPHHVLGCETIAKQIHRVAKQIHRI